MALKMILSGPHADAELLGRFRAEAEAFAQLQHPNIVKIYDIGEESGLPYFSLEFVEGQTLDEFRDSQPVNERTAAKLMEKIARAMHFAHDAGIVHRDLKPANVLLTKEGEPKVTDFGLVKRIEGDDIDSQTQTGAIMGTPHYMAPEQAWGKADIGRETDVWALGAMLYALLTGRAPFVGANTMDTLMQLKENEPVTPSELVSSVTVDIETICLKCLQKETGRRYGTALELGDDIRRYLDGIPILARPVGRTERAWRWCRRKPLIAGLTATVAVAILAGTKFSVTFGVMANNAAIAEGIAREDAVEKQVYAEQKEREAQDNAERANDNADLAERNADSALKQRTVALAAFNSAVEWAGTDLKSVPGTEKFKLRLFGAAVEGLNRLSELVGDDRQDLALARGYAKTGEGYMEIG
ncbi:MAG: serine/threonine-protein kinase [Fuerstiella sp.]|nr:serine/threonine-protein kinase [Fuerstiella sp.]